MTFNKYFYYSLFSLLLLSMHTGSARSNNTTSDSIRLSLLTCDAGEEIYSLFGHTAIRYEVPEKSIDYVFNYGVFSFNTPNFVMRFVRGETDYMLGVSNYSNFAAEYAFRDRSVWQQELNLTQIEKERLVQRLIVNAQPENRTYRYNFLYDNCATRVRDIIEDCIDGKVLYAEENLRKSFRHIIHEYSKNHPWDRFGMDLCLGIEADKPITYREEMFAPFYLMNAFECATITNKQGEKRKLTAEATLVVEAEAQLSSPPFFTPLRTSLLFFILIASVTIYGLRKRKSLWGIDVLIFALFGLAGCVIAFLTFFSEHPAVSSNYLIILFHPLHLLLLPFFIRKERKQKRSCYHVVNTVVLTFFILLWALIPQQFDFAVLPLALSLLTRSGSHLVLTYKEK
ncbi:DUF4105 domain-containing protein [Bacteroides sp. 214]|uniref:lipoprotein N-acyltransferase Lnb n=1 Tax=Bacteroides sp. 214 TaxID=2302935 RepID=UPI0013D4DC97|nr:DUF4105 domain-containing protein [Bacteroides sp. 214]NDW13248.1 DUF4105 domain-containing protein [Bacteroides sp. 214]